MFGPAVTAIKAHIASSAVTLWPIRWANEPWANGTWADDNDNPRDDAGAPIPFIEGEIVGGENRITGFSSSGNRLWIHQGLLRLYLMVPTGSGTDSAMTTADAFAADLERAQITITGGQAVRFMDFRSFHDVATTDIGNYFVVMCSCIFEFSYTA